MTLREVLVNQEELFWLLTLIPSSVSTESKPLSPPPPSNLNNPSDSHFIALMIFLFEPFYCMPVFLLFLLSSLPYYPSFFIPLVPLQPYYPFPQPYHSSSQLKALSFLHCHCVMLCLHQKGPMLSTNPWTSLSYIKHGIMWNPFVLYFNWSVHEGFYI